MRRCQTFLALLGLACLAGCAEPKPVGPPPTLLAALPPPEVPVPAPVIPPVPPPKPPIPHPAPEKTVYVPDELIGLDQPGVVKLLGSPLDSRNEGAARVLTYRGKSCQLDVILFLDVKTGTERVLSYDQQPTAGKNAVACYATLRK